MERKKLKGVSYAKYGYIFSIPFVLAFLVFSLYPIIYTIIIGFTDLQGVGMRDFDFLPDPLGNFKTIFDDPVFYQALSNTFILWIINFIPQIALALLLTAWFTNQTIRVRGQGAFKVLLYMPNIITAATIAILFNALFMSPMSPMNELFLNWHLTEEPIQFLQNRWTVRGIVAFIQFWMWYGNTMIVLIAGVMGISPALFEAAQIDGASATQIFFRVTLPNLRTILLYTLVTSMIGGLQMFDIPKLLTGTNGPGNVLVTTSVFIYNKAFGMRNLYNHAAAASVVMFVIVAALSGILFYVMRDKDAARRKKEEKLAAQAAKGALS